MITNEQFLDRVNALAISTFEEENKHQELWPEVNYFMSKNHRKLSVSDTGKYDIAGINGDCIGHDMTRYEVVSLVAEEKANGYDFLVGRYRKQNRPGFSDQPAYRPDLLNEEGK